MADIFNNVGSAEENKKEVWEVDRVKYQYKSKILAFSDEMLTNSNYPSRLKQTFGDITTEATYNEFEGDEDEIYKSIKGWTNKGGGNRIFGLSSDVTVNSIIETQEHTDLIKEKEKALVSSLRREGEKRSNPKLKRHYADLADILDEEKGDYTRMEFTSPYMFGINSGFIQLNNPKGLSSEQEKGMLSEPLFNASYDYLHSVADEVRINYERQKLEDKGNVSAQEKRKYLSDLKKTHEQYIKGYTQLNNFVDDKQGRNRQDFGNTLVHLYGRGSGPNEERNVVGHAGMIIGEKQAIDNGWDLEEIGILSAIGSIGEQIKRLEKYGSDEQKEGLSQFKADFYKLKSECYNTRVDSAESKKVIADKVKAFVDGHSSVAAKKCMSCVVNSRKALDDSIEAVNKAIEREKSMENPPGALKNTNIYEYLKQQEALAIETGDFDALVTEIALAAEAQSSTMNEEQSDLFDEYMESLKNQNDEFKEKLSYSTGKIYAKGRIELAREQEELAYRIRMGDEPVAPEFENIKKDYKTSMIIANQKMEHKSAAWKMSYGINAFSIAFNAIYDNPQEIMKNGSDDYVNNGADGLSKVEADYYLSAGATDAADDAIDGIKQNYGTRQIISIDEEKVNNGIDKNIEKSDNYVKDVMKMVAEAQEKLKKLDELRKAKPTAVYDTEKKKFFDMDAPLKPLNPKHPDAERRKEVKLKDANSIEFMNMYDALKDVAGITFEDTPMDIQKKLDRLSSSSNTYQGKIEGSFFAGRKGNGSKRYEQSGELIDFADEYKESLSKSAKGAVSPNEKLQDIGIRNRQVEAERDARKANEAQAQNAAQQAGAGANIVPPNNEKVDFDAELESAGKEVMNVADKSGIQKMDKNDCIKPMARIATITVIQNQEKLTGKSLSYTKEEFNEVVRKMEEDSLEFKRVMSELRPDQIYNRATLENDRALLINDLNEAKNVIEKENELKNEALKKKEEVLEKDRVLENDKVMNFK